MEGTVREDMEEETRSPSIMQVAEKAVTEDSEEERRRREENQEQQSVVTEDSVEEKQSKIISTQSDQEQQDTQSSVTEDSEEEKQSKNTSTQSDQEQQDTRSAVTEDSDEEKQSKIIPTQSDQEQQDTRSAVTEDSVEEKQSKIISTQSNHEQEDTRSAVTEDSEEEKKSEMISTQSDQEQQDTRSAETEDSNKEKQSKLTTTQSGDDKEEFVEEIDVKSDEEEKEVILDSIKIEIQEEVDPSTDASDSERSGSTSPEDDKYIPPWSNPVPRNTNPVFQKFNPAPQNTNPMLPKTVPEGTIFQNVGKLREKHKESLAKEEEQGDIIVPSVEIGYGIPDRTIYENYEPPPPPVPPRPKSEVAKQPPPVPGKSFRNSYPQGKDPPPIPEKSFKSKSNISPDEAPPAIPEKSVRISSGDTDTKPKVPERSLRSSDIVESKRDKLEDPSSRVFTPPTGNVKETQASNITDTEASANISAEKQTESVTKQENQAKTSVKDRVSMFESKGEGDRVSALKLVGQPEKTASTQVQKTFSTPKDSDSDSDEFHSMEEDEKAFQPPPSIEPDRLSKDDFPSYEKSSDSVSLVTEQSKSPQDEILSFTPTSSSEASHQEATNLQSIVGDVYSGPGFDTPCHQKKYPSDEKCDVNNRPITKDENIEQATEPRIDPLSSGSHVPETTPITGPSAAHVPETPQFTGPNATHVPETPPFTGPYATHVPETPQFTGPYATHVPETPSFTRPDTTQVQGQSFVKQQQGQHQHRPTSFSSQQQGYSHPSTYMPQGGYGGHYTPYMGKPSQGFSSQGQGLPPHSQGQRFGVPPQGHMFGHRYSGYPGFQQHRVFPHYLQSRIPFFPLSPEEQAPYTPPSAEKQEPETPPPGKKQKKKTKKDTEKKEKKDNKKTVPRAEPKLEPESSKGPVYVCVQGIKADVNSDNFVNMLEAMSKSKSKVFDIDINSVVYGVDNTIAVAKFLEKPDLEILKNKILRKGMDICEVEPPTRVMVSVKREMPSDRAFRQYFEETKKARVKRVKETEEGTCIVEFHDSEYVSEVSSGKVHQIETTDMFVSTYFDTQFGEVWEQQKHFVPMPGDIPLTDVDRFKKLFIIEKTKIQGLLNDKLKNDHAKIKVTEELHIECTLEQTTDNVRYLVKNWKQNVLKTWKEFVEEVTHKEEMKINSEIWHRLHEHIQKEKVHDDLKIDISEDGESIKLVFVGTRDLLCTVIQTVTEEKTKIEDDIKRKAAITSEVMKVPRLYIGLLIKTCVLEDLKSIANDLEVSCSGPESGEITLRGVPCDINQAKCVILESKEKFIKFKLRCKSDSEQSESDSEQEDIHKDQLAMLKAHESDILDLLEKGKVIVEIEFAEDFIHGCAENELDKSKAENILKNTVKRSSRMFKSKESKAVLYDVKWKKELSEIRHDFNDKVNILVDEANSQIILTSLADIHEDLMKRMEDFVHSNAIYQKSIKISDKGKMEFIRKHCQVDFEEMENKLSEFSVHVTLSDSSVEISGTKNALQKAESQITNIVKGIQSKSHEISRLGIDSVISPDKKELFKTVERDARCVVTFQDTATDCDDLLSSSDSEDDYVKMEVSETWRSEGAGKADKANIKPIPSAGNKNGSYKCRNGTKISLVKGELGRQKADVLVCSTSKEVNLTGGKAGKNLLSCGGTSLQDECKSKFPDGLSPGHVGSINPGNLSCKKVYLGTLPDWSKEHNKPTKVVSNFVKNCLSNAASEGFVSICFASLGTGGLKYPPQKAAELMYDAVIRYDRKHNSCVKDVRFILYPSDHMVVHAFEREEFSRLNPSANPSLLKPTKLSGPFKTGNGISITVVKDLIDKQKADVIACAVDNKLTFGGGVAKALKGAGGDTLVAECKSKFPAGIQYGQVFEISGGKLNCKKIYLTCLPDFRNEEEQAKTALTEKTLYKVITDMLGMAVKAGFSSISLPAMGTGQIHYPGHFVASLMYICVMDFAKKNPNSCLTDVRFVIHPKDTKIVMAFDHEEQLHLTPPVVYSSGAKSFRSKSSNINVSIETGNIAKFTKADIIVCPVSDNLDLSQGQTSNSLLNEDGSLQQECKIHYPQGIKIREIAQIKPSKMPCKHVYFVTLPKCTPGREVEAEVVLKETIIQILEEASKAGYTSVGVPSMGTGFNMYPYDRAAYLSYLAVNAFDKSQKSSSLKSVFFVILGQDVKALEAFKEEERRQAVPNFPLQETPVPPVPSVPTQGAEGGKTLGVGAKIKRTFFVPEDDGNTLRKPFRRTPSNKTKRRSTLKRPMIQSIRVQAKPHEIHFGKLSLKIVQGNIVEQRDKLDILVNCTDINMDFKKGGVTATMLEKCDKQKLDTEAEQKKPEMKKNEITHTSDCGLNCKVIIHMASQGTLKDWQAMLVKCFLMADDLGHESLALPAVGTDQSFTVFKCEDMAKVIHDSLVIFSSLRSNPNLLFVRLVVSDKDIRFPMNEKISKCSEELQSNPEYMETIKEDMSMFGPVPSSELRSRKDRVSLWVLSDSNSNIERAIKMIEKLIQDKFITKDFQDTIINDLSKEEVSHFEKLQKSFPVKISVDQQNSVVMVTGFSDHIQNVTDQIYKLCSKFQTERFLDGEAKMIQENVQWFYKETNSQGLLELMDYPPRINMGLENTRKGNFKTYCFQSDGESCIVDVENMKEYFEKDKNDTSKHIDVIRREKLEGGNYDLPEDWEPMPVNDIVKPFVLQATTQKYADLEKMFTTSVLNGKFKNQFNAAKLKIVKIERIQNPTLFKQYMCKKSEMETYFPQGAKLPLEQVLWHGTPETSVVSINYYGFNRSYCGKNGTWFGAGVYFANDASYSARDWVSPKTGQKKIIYLARVLTGQYVKGTKDMRVLPPLPTNPGRNFDSSVDNDQNPLEFAVYNDTQAYPEYCIHFTKD